MQIVKDFTDYQILAMQNGQKLEDWHGVILSRPDPQVIWEDKQNISKWSQAAAVYKRSNTGGGAWQINKKIPASWMVSYHDLTFNLKLMGFKHTGLFPEQAYNWNYLQNKIKSSNRKDIKVLNLFAYTGAATVACLKAGASVVHVDASKGMIDWAKENVKINHLEDKEVHFLVDDCLKFVQREIRRGHKYDGIIMDPPSFGRGSNGEVWDVNKDLFPLASLCTELLSDKPLFFIINSYTTGLSLTVLSNILKLTVNQKCPGNILADELGLPMVDSDLVLPCGEFARWEKED
jgi:23S rRNA (cytosine1962-C5)-methyltransferase